MSHSSLTRAAGRAIVLIGLGMWLYGCPGGTRPSPSAPPEQVGDNANKTRPYVVFGQRYVPITSAAGYRERGVASWYGKEFDGRPTANGEVFDMHQLTAAHKTLPLPTYVEVTNLRNGRRVVVRVNDRGPFVDNRLIDLSYAAARELDMIGPGTSLVDVRALESTQVEASTAAASVTAAAPPPATVDATPTLTSPAPAVGAAAPPPATPIPITATTASFVQVGAFSQPANAFAVVDALEQGGLAGVRVEEIVRNGAPLYRVRVGPVEDVAQFDALVEQLATMGYPGARLAVD